MSNTPLNLPPKESHWSTHAKLESSTGLRPYRFLPELISSYCPPHSLLIKSFQLLGAEVYMRVQSLPWKGSETVRKIEAPHQRCQTLGRPDTGRQTLPWARPTSGHPNSKVQKTGPRSSGCSTPVFAPRPRVPPLRGGSILTRAGAPRHRERGSGAALQAVQHRGLEGAGGPGRCQRRTHVRRVGTRVVVVMVVVRSV